MASDAQKARMEAVRKLLEEFGFKYLGVSEGHLETVAQRQGPDTAENRVERLVGAGQLKLRRGRWHARVGAVKTSLWSWEAGAGQTDRARTDTKALDGLRRWLEERFPRQPGLPPAA